MNNLSSILTFIGNVIGANPSTLTTTSKTLVGSINEINGVMRRIHVSTANPTTADGNNGDIWLKYIDEE